MRRLIMLAVVALALAPGTLVRTATTEPDLRQILQIEPLTISDPELGNGLTIEKVWHLTSPNEYFGGYSGLAALGEGELLAVSDKGGWLRFRPEGASRGGRFGALPRASARNKHLVDAEALEFDPESGRVWIGYEGSNRIESSTPDMRDVRRAYPEAMRHWSGNSGPEAMARLPDGRFLVIGEGSPDWFGEGFPGLLFDGDPVDGARATAFGFETPEGFNPTDIAILPDGKALLVLRSVEAFIPPRFGTKLALADTSEIEAGRTWRAEILAALPATLPLDNFEGLAAVANGDGTVTLWMISDDNGMLAQRTLLYKMRWDPSQARQ